MLFLEKMVPQNFIQKQVQYNIYFMYAKHETKDLRHELALKILMFTQKT